MSMENTPDHSAPSSQPSRQPRRPPTFVYPVRSLLEGIQQATEASEQPRLPSSQRNAVDEEKRRCKTPQVGPSIAIVPASPTEYTSSEKCSVTRQRASSTSGIPDFPPKSRPEGKTKSQKVGRKISPNFRHFPAGDDPSSQPTFSTPTSNLIPASNPTCLAHIETVSPTIPADRVLGQNILSIPPRSPLPLVAAEALATISPTLLPTPRTRETCLSHPLPRLQQPKQLHN
ncbi:unnamed protein product [Cyclocybe aegerita]|uniref:Uncharacterized protein n=1 Tax=Cyclocybe aegerita TaxID=1973307 RepID=A0A8S0XNW3_CYCAE|nr:unnamed protein product [Cyclocybe aegerita]